MILLSFDVEEFDMPFEYGKDISFEKQMSVSIEGTNKILELLSDQNVKATFFVTANFAVNAPGIVHKIVANGHELASHGYYHSDFKPEHLLMSKEKLQEISGQEVIGYRMARMMPVDEQKIAEAGYKYNTSVNPTFLPGRYNNLHISRTLFKDAGIWQIPASVTPLVRFPLFWLSFHNLPLGLYKKLALWTYKNDGYLNTYFHPWEFIDLSIPELGMPGFVQRNSGEKMMLRMHSLISYFKRKNIEFGTISRFIQDK